ncbi:MAG: hypothetical protein WC851_02700 [Candidatus Shapirobacteria bacterium]|jgi:hypothetical protein
MGKSKKLFKVVVFGPIESEKIIRKTIEKLAVGRIGKYSGWTFCSYGITRVRAMPGANPAKGQVGKIEKIKEFRMETACFETEKNKLIEAIKSVHPYEVVPIDVFEVVGVK